MIIKQHIGGSLSKVGGHAERRAFNERINQSLIAGIKAEK